MYSVRSMIGWLLVIAQFVIFALLLWPTSTPVWSICGLLLAIAGMWVGIWTLTHNQPGNFNIHPQPKTGGRLVTSGPYHYVRHPMYTALLLATAAVVCFYDIDKTKLAIWIALGLVLWLKTSLEERALQKRYPMYADYARRTGRFIPWL
jgi:protein-S-isoprenylcysteine O-methyltransferase Ste14